MNLRSSQIRSCSIRFGSSHRKGFGNHRLHNEVTSGAGWVHHMALVAGVGSGVVLNLLNRGATLLDCHMVDDFFFRDILAIADNTHADISLLPPKIAVASQGCLKIFYHNTSQTRGFKK